LSAGIWAAVISDEASLASHLVPSALGRDEQLYPRLESEIAQTARAFVEVVQYRLAHLSGALAIEQGPHLGTDGRTVGINRRHGISLVLVAHDETSVRSSICRRRRNLR
jgi:hypothetical protein